MKKRNVWLAIGVVSLAVLLLSNSSEGVSRSELTRSWIRAVVEKYFDSLGTQDLERFVSCFAGQVNWHGRSITREELRETWRQDFNDHSDVKIVDFGRERIRWGRRGAGVTCKHYWSYCSAASADCGEALVSFGLVKEREAWKIRSIRNSRIYWTSADSKVCRCDVYMAKRR